MKIVERGLKQPGLCVLTHDSNGPFVDTEADINCERVGINPHIYIHVPIAEQIGRTVGMVSQSVLDSAEATIEQLRGDVEDLTKELDKERSAVDAIATLERVDFKAKKRPGRPPKVAA